jgi:hypothetical protein
MHNSLLIFCAVEYQLVIQRPLDEFWSLFLSLIRLYAQALTLGWLEFCFQSHWFLLMSGKLFLFLEA